jgi:hypothetical protein
MPNPTAIFGAVALALIAGCGGGGAGDERLSHDEFLTRANEICREASRDASVPQNPEGDAEIADALDAAAAVVRHRRSQLSELQPPAELESDFDGFLRNDELAADTLARGADAVREQGKLAVLGIAAVQTEIKKKGEHFARRIGMTDCVGPD